MCYQHPLFPGRLRIFCIASCLFCMACKKLLTIPPPEKNLRSQEIFSDNQHAEAAATGLYHQMAGNDQWITNGGATLYAGLSADELYNYFSNESLDEFFTNSLNAGNNYGIAVNLWQAGYKNIYHANAVLEGLDASKGLSEAIKKRLRGEMLLARALHYFYLVNFFGDIPLITTTNYRVNEQLPRAPVTDVYGQLLNDLEEALTLLPETFPATGRSKPNKYAAAALLARTHLYLGNWTNAGHYAGVVIDVGPFALANEPAKVFGAVSEETIWQLPGSGTTYHTSEGYFFIPYDTLTIPEFGVTTFLLDAFEPGDLRRAQWLGMNKASGVALYYPYKYKTRNSMRTPEQYILLRLAEQYLVRAEAYAMQHRLVESLDDLNRIRHRAGLPRVVNVSQDSLLTAIRQERRVELFAEWGHRWLDLKRTKQADTILGRQKAPGWQPTDVLYPIPAGQILLNPTFTQNPGYD